MRILHYDAHWHAHVQEQLVGSHCDVPWAMALIAIFDASSLDDCTMQVPRWPGPVLLQHETSDL